MELCAIVTRSTEQVQKCGESLEQLRRHVCPKRNAAACFATANIFSSTTAQQRRRKEPIVGRLDFWNRNTEDQERYSEAKDPIARGFHTRLVHPLLDCFGHNSSSFHPEPEATSFRCEPLKK
jgi:hypothetical protein